MMKGLVIGAVAVLSLPGAAFAQAPARPVSIVRDAASVAGCTELGEVRASSMLGGAMANAGYDRALSQLRERSVALGATHVQIIDSASGMTGSRILATAFRCPAAPAATPSPTTP